MQHATASREQQSLRTQANRSRFTDFVRDNPILCVAIAVALIVRISFWVYTGRLWEDALITVTHALNVWEGNGLTHHPSEPRVHGFTSALSVLIPIVGVPFGSGFVALRLASLIGSVATLIYAHRIMKSFNVGNAALIFVLGYLALEQQQIFFGMAGMETQVAVAVLLASVNSIQTNRPRAAGILAGLCLLARPDFILWLIPAGLVLLVVNRALLWRALPWFFLTFGPWVIFATLYFGSPIPHTIGAKNLYRGRGGDHSPSLAQLFDYTAVWWRSFSPFWTNVFTTRTPLPIFLLQALATTFISLSLVGLWVRRRSPAIIAVAGFIVAFFAYRTRTLLPTYFMWYLPPFLACCAVAAGLGLEWLRQFVPKATMLIALGMVALFALPLPFMFVLERRIQDDIEYGVRAQVGQYVDDHLEPGGAVALEPLGYIGYYAFGKTIYDYPGLASPAAQAALRALPERQRSLQGLIAATHPAMAVLRPYEWERYQRDYPEDSENYVEVARFDAPSSLDLSWLGLDYYTIDTSFIVFRRDETMAASS